MILVGNQRSGAKNLALHLLKEENEHVEVHEIRGFASQNLTAALNEAYAISRATRCKQYLFSLSLNPPQDANIATVDFEDAIERIEDRLGLSGQPRAIVFHEKEGRRHCHTVWSRIDAEEMKAVPLPYTKRKLQEIARDLYLKHGWTMPRGLANSKESDPKNFSLAQWQQAKRIGKDPRAIKATFQDCWAISDSGAAFINAMEDRGYKVARGDRRGFVAIDFKGEIYAIAKWANVKTKQVRTRLGDENSLPSAREVKQQIAQEMLVAMGKFKDKLDSQKQERNKQFEKRRIELVTRQRAERKTLNDKLEQRQTAECAERQNRYRSGIMGFWDLLSGTHNRIKKQNALETDQATIRDRAEKDALITRHLEQRKRLNTIRIQERSEYQSQKQEIQKDAQTYKSMLSEMRDQKMDKSRRERQYSDTSTPSQKRTRSRSLDQ